MFRTRFAVHRRNCNDVTTRRNISDGYTPRFRHTSQRVYGRKSMSFVIKYLDLRCFRVTGHALPSNNQSVLSLYALEACVFYNPYFLGK
jgi:hypothetical protein